MEAQNHKRISRRLSYVLRHRPAAIGIELDEQGWVRVETLLEALARHGLRLTEAELEEVVQTNDKQRFTLDHGRIRAAQGHTVKVRLDFESLDPPDTLFHGTPVRNLGAIREQGLNKRRRHHVHLSPDPETAAKVGARRGEFVILTVDAARMAQDGHVFYRSTNGVWLTDRVPPEYLDSNGSEGTAWR